MNRARGGFENRWIAITCVFILGTSCVEPLDSTRTVKPERSVGEVIYEDICQRVAHGEDPGDVSGTRSRPVCRDGVMPEQVDPTRLAALHGERQRFITAVDYALEQPLAGDLDTFLKRVLPLFEDVNLKAQTVALANVLGDIEGSPEALAALTRLATREGYRPLELRPGVISPLLNYARIDQVITELLGIVGEGGDARASWQAFLGSLYQELSNLDKTDLAGADNALELVRDLMLTSRADFSDGVGRFVVKRDSRGIATLDGGSPADWQGSFTDINFDGLPDVDEQGNYVDQAGAALLVGAPFRVPGEATLVRDDYHRLLGDQGRLVYSYIDASETLAAASLYEAGRILQQDPQAFMNLLYPLEVVLGPQQAKTETYDNGQTLAFDGFDTADTPILDVAHAAGNFLHTPEFYYLLKLTEELLVTHEAELANLVGTLLLIRDWADLPPFDTMEGVEKSVLADDVIDLLVDAARTPGLLEDMLDALDDPRTRPLPSFFARYLRFKDTVNYQVDADGNINGDAVTSGLEGTNSDFNYTSPVDRDSSDSTGNRSLFQRFSHLIYDTTGAKLCNREGAVMDMGWITYPLWGDGYAECELFEVEDMAAFYVKVILGTGQIEYKDSVVEALSNIDFLLESLSGIDGFTKTPTLRAVNRAMFGERNEFLQGILDAPQGLDGTVLASRHPATIFAWEEPGFTDSMMPMLEAVAAHGREDLVGKMLGLFHKHWPTTDSDFVQTTEPSAPLFVYGTGLSQYEELVARSLDEGDIMNVAGDFAGAALELPMDGYDGKVWLAKAIRQLVLPELNQGLTTRTGATTMMRGDGVTPMAEVTPVRLAIDAARKLDALFEGYDAEKEALFGALDAVVDTVLLVNTEGDTASFEDRRAYAAVSVMLRFLRDRIDAHSQAGDLVSWATQMPDDAKALLDEPLFQTGVGLVSAVVNSATTRTELEQALLYLCTQSSPNDAYTVTAGALVDVLQLSTDDTNLVPLLNTVAPALEPSDGVLVHLLQFMADANELDDKQVSTRLMRRLLTDRAGDSETAFEALVEIAGRVNREVPGAEENWSQADYAKVLQVIREFLVDEDHGLERLYQLLENR